MAGFAVLDGAGGARDGHHGPAGGRACGRKRARRGADAAGELRIRVLPHSRATRGFSGPGRAALRRGRRRFRRLRSQHGRGRRGRTTDDLAPVRRWAQDLRPWRLVAGLPGAPPADRPA
eukprot:scaffold819_cov350-Prasinococcus_capsulatus_cf.AAC.4